ncbi:Sodium- and chloride-dependent GABA transporter 2,Sodium-dependent proline transporter,Sodium-dependent dopamine transporter,Sodium- and chloride-dependent glycine transporter 2,Sodium-dependent noradrenaline transporter,Sodium- and chloride-dependent GABA transporter 1,Sodium- and chloride-dependent betaine transporter,Sodium-dependent neutral amino acid transporter B(0)AT2,Sodium-dependent neutral amino acid transporter SLC6A17,Sodium-dependent serotonin transporter,Sodium- and chloride-dependent GABA tr|uniref:Transporter n=1 Tax=Mytilus edulis TaxID=6550 RepID=A0A8S3R1X1_MYTED|nr:Sodium- and chloride-dependent GABA transporter 2,Sodium-dependent proline transporter,Sodium-dependent dopamine transporter,Sodium- and chloride-dependent glycine transporter 2,Sodium-dependent noradrenaline transporter,Sodium- and chloride-dependent GABA transporter 1,Sodium- and chloride-dependent betaine transporter,Sodium-dependent neutral amino acid transporter B(0)AT2,Sodium-dependent neutral amino acid transporter SLC6A17,Sodium-dependent serotonin transporter,Sodium- and chloride-depend
MDNPAGLSAKLAVNRLEIFKLAGVRFRKSSWTFIKLDTKDSYNINNGLKERNGDVDVNVDEDTEDRGQWGSKWEFILSCIGLSVGLGNVWRFPYLAYENGGAAFLIAYLVLQFLIGKPMYFMELVMGQFCGLGPTGVWKMNPSAKGIGISMALISLVVAIYYNVIMVYTLIYFFSSMQKTLPWTVCEDEWLPLGCVEQSTQKLDYCSMNITQLLTDNKACRCFLNATDSILSDQGFNCTNVTYQGDVPVPVAQLYFDKTVINKADDFYPDTGNPQWKSSGKNDKRILIVFGKKLRLFLVLFDMFISIELGNQEIYFYKNYTSLK